MAKKISRSRAAITATLLPNTGTFSSNGVRSNAKLINIPEILMNIAENELRNLVPGLPPKPAPIVYPLPSTIIIPPSDQPKASKLLIEYLTMSIHKTKIKPPNGGNCTKPCIVAGHVDCCDSVPTLLAEAGEAVVADEKKAFVVPQNFELLFFDEENFELDASVRTVVNNSELKYYRVVDEDFLHHIEIIADENYKYEP